MFNNKQPLLSNSHLQCSFPGQTPETNVGCSPRKATSSHCNGSVQSTVNQITHLEFRCPYGMETVRKRCGAYLPSIEDQLNESFEPVPPSPWKRILPHRCLPDRFVSLPRQLPGAAAAITRGTSTRLLAELKRNLLDVLPTMIVCVKMQREQHLGRHVSTHSEIVCPA